MNWVGGVRNRIRLQQEKKQQKEFFERKKFTRRLRRILPDSGKNGPSLDLLSLHMVSKTHSDKKNFEARQNANRVVTEVNLDYTRPRFQNYEDLESPMTHTFKHPQSVNTISEKLQAVEEYTSIDEEKPYMRVSARISSTDVLAKKSFEAGALKHTRRAPSDLLTKKKGVSFDVLSPEDSGPSSHPAAILDVPKYIKLSGNRSCSEPVAMNTAISTPCLKDNTCHCDGYYYDYGHPRHEPLSEIPKYSFSDQEPETPFLEDQNIHNLKHHTGRSTCLNEYPRNHADQELTYKRPQQLITAAHSTVMKGETKRTYSSAFAIEDFQKAALKKYQGNKLVKRKHKFGDSMNNGTCRHEKNMIIIKHDNSYDTPSRSWRYTFHKDSDDEDFFKYTPRKMPGNMERQREEMHNLNKANIAQGIIDLNPVHMGKRTSATSEEITENNKNMWEENQESDMDENTLEATCTQSSYSSSNVMNPSQSTFGHVKREENKKTEHDNDGQSHTEKSGKDESRHHMYQTSLNTFLSLQRSPVNNQGFEEHRVIESPHEDKKGTFQRSETEIRSKIAEESVQELLQLDIENPYILAPCSKVQSALFTGSNEASHRPVLSSTWTHNVDNSPPMDLSDCEQDSCDQPATTGSQVAIDQVACDQQTTTRQQTSNDQVAPTDQHTQGAATPYVLLPQTADKHHMPLTATDNADPQTGSDQHRKQPASDQQLASHHMDVNICIQSSTVEPMSQSLLSGQYLLESATNKTHQAIDVHTATAENLVGPASDEALLEMDTRASDSAHFSVAGGLQVAVAKSSYGDRDTINRPSTYSVTDTAKTQVSDSVSVSPGRTLTTDVTLNFTQVRPNTEKDNAQDKVQLSSEQQDLPKFATKHPASEQLSNEGTPLGIVSKKAPLRHAQDELRQASEPGSPLGSIISTSHEEMVVFSLQMKGFHDTGTQYSVLSPFKPKDIEIQTILPHLPVFDSTYTQTMMTGIKLVDKAMNTIISYSLDSAVIGKDVGVQCGISPLSKFFNQFTQTVTPESVSVKDAEVQVQTTHSMVDSWTNPEHQDTSYERKGKQCSPECHQNQPIYTHAATDIFGLGYVQSASTQTAVKAMSDAEPLQTLSSISKQPNKSCNVI